MIKVMEMEDKVFPRFNSNANFGQVHLELGMEFETLDIFKKVVRNYIVYRERDTKWLKNKKAKLHFSLSMFQNIMILTLH